MHPAFLTPVQPAVRCFTLLVAAEGLTEQAAVIGKAHTISRIAKGCQRVNETGSQTAQTAVAKRRFRFELFQLRDILAGIRQFFLNSVIQPEIDQVVGQKLADEKLS